MSLISDIGLRTRVFESLAQSIMKGQMAPGDRLVVRKIAATLGVSATPVREALVELHELGLVEIIPNRGAVCLPFGARQLGEIYLVRRVLEAEATRLACPFLSLESLTNLRLHSLDLLEDEAINTPSWCRSAIDLDIQLHDSIAAACGANRLTHEIERYGSLMRIIRQVLNNFGDLQQIAISEHIVIIDALLARDANGAVSAMSDHLDHTAAKVVDLFSKDLVSVNTTEVGISK